MSASLRTTVYTTDTAPSARPVHLAVSSYTSLQIKLDVQFSGKPVRDGYIYRS